MGKETYQIKESGYDEVQAFGVAFGILGERKTPKEDFSESTDFNNLESSLPPDTIKFATYVNKEYSTKIIYFYVCSFTEKTTLAKHQEVYSLFSIRWDESDGLWVLNPWYCCSVLSEEPQTPLHKEAANWMFKRVASKGCLIASVDDFKNGTLEILRGKETSQLSEQEALSIYARMLHTLDSSEFESFLSEDFSYSSQEVLTDMNSKDEFIEYIRPKLETIKKSKKPVYAELGVCPAYGHTNCLIMAQGNKSNLLGVAYASVGEGKICSLALCIVPTPDSAERSGIYPGLNDQDSNSDEIDPDLNDQDSNLDKIDPSQMYVSYSYTKTYDSYIGSKQWNEIDEASRIEIARIEFKRLKYEIYDSEGELFNNLDNAVMNSGLLKSQYKGLRSILVEVGSFYQDVGIIQSSYWSSQDYDKILDFFKGKKFYKEFNTLLNDVENYECEYDGSELEKFSWGTNVDDPFDDADEMSIDERERFMLSFLEDLPGESKDEFVKEELDEDIKVTKRVNEVKHDTRFLTSNPASPSCIQSFLRYKFAPSEVRWISEEISYFFRCNEFIFGDSCKLSALRMAKDADRAKYSIRVNQMKPKQLALLLITNVAWNELASGKHHIYRGVLSVIGNDYLRIFKVALSSSLELGYIDSDEQRDDLKKLEMAIKEVG